MNDLDNQFDGDEFQHHVARMEAAPWAAPRGPKTKIVVWVIIIVFALSVLIMLIAIIIGSFNQ